MSYGRHTWRLGRPHTFESGETKPEPQRSAVCCPWRGLAFFSPLIDTHLALKSGKLASDCPICYGRSGCIFGTYDNQESTGLFSHCCNQPVDCCFVPNATSDGVGGMYNSARHSSDVITTQPWRGQGVIWRETHHLRPGFAIERND